MKLDEFTEKINNVDWTKVSGNDAITFGMKMSEHDDSLWEKEVHDEQHKTRILAYVEGLTVGIIAYVLSLIFSIDPIILACSLYLSCILFHVLKSRLIKKALEYVEENNRRDVEQFIERIVSTQK